MKPSFDVVVVVFILLHQIYRQGCLLTGQGPVPRNDVVLVNLHTLSTEVATEI